MNLLPVGDAIILVLLLALSALFSGAETALISLSKGRAEGLAREKRRGSQALYSLKCDSQRMLIAILIGNNVVNITASALATVIATRTFGSFGPGLAVGVLTILVLVFGEITPKSLATRYSERISLMVAPFIFGFLRAVGPLVSVFQSIADVIGRAASESNQDPMVTESELISLINYGEEEGTIEESERQLIERAFAFTDLIVADVMTPRHRVFSLDGRQSAQTALTTLLDTPYSRIPLHEDDPDEIISILQIRDLLPVVASGENKAAPLLSLGREPKFVPDSQSVTETITSFRREQQHMAVVVDEHGTMRGVVTFEDLLEELVGEIYDERDEVPRALVELGDYRIAVDGAAELRVVEEYFGIDLPGKATDTVNRWILERVERIPNDGETFQFEGLEVTVKSATRRRIDEVIIEHSGREVDRTQFPE